MEVTEDQRFSFLNQLVSRPSPSLVCSICQDLFHDPVINPSCSHSFCGPCIKRAEAETCPLCRAPLYRARLHPNLALAGLIGELLAWCKFKKYGCSAELTLDELATHEALCPYSPFKCPHVARGCGFSGTQKNLAEHLQHCPYEGLVGFLDAIEAKFTLLEQKVADQSREIAALREQLQGRAALSPHVSADEQDDLTRSFDPQALDVSKFECVGVIPNAHISGVTALCAVSVSHAKFLLYSGSHDSRLKVWEVDRENPCEHQLKGDVQAHRYTIWSVLQLHGGMYSASADGLISCWDPETLRKKSPSKPISHPGKEKIYCMTSLDENLLVSGSADKTVRVWDVRSGEPVATLEGHTRSVWSVKNAQPALECSLLSAGNGGNVKLWDTRTWKARLTMNNNSNDALSVECSETHIFAGSSSSKIYAFDVNTGELSQSLGGHQWEVWQLDMSRSKDLDASCLVSGSYDHKIKLWSTEDLTPLNTLVGHKGAVHCLRSVDDMILSGSGDKSIRIWAQPHH